MIHCCRSGLFSTRDDSNKVLTPFVFTVKWKKKKNWHAHTNTFVCARVIVYTGGRLLFKANPADGSPTALLQRGAIECLAKGLLDNNLSPPLPSPALSHSYGAQISQRQSRMRQSPTSLHLPRSYFKSIVEGHNGRLAAFHFSRQQVGGSLPTVCNNANGRRMNSVGCAKWEGEPCAVRMSVVSVLVGGVEGEHLPSLRAFH